MVNRVVCRFGRYAVRFAISRYIKPCHLRTTMRNNIFYTHINIDCVLLALHCRCRVMWRQSQNDTTRPCVTIFSENHSIEWVEGVLPPRHLDCVVGSSIKSSLIYRLGNERCVVKPIAKAQLLRNDHKAIRCTAYSNVWSRYFVNIVRHYFDAGATRWFGLDIVRTARLSLQGIAPRHKQF